MAASQTAKLLIQRGADGRLRCASDPEMEGDHSGDRGDCEGDRISVLVESLVVVGRRLGVLNIEKYVAALDLADQVATAWVRCRARARVRCRARATRGRLHVTPRAHVAALDQTDQVEAIKEIYYRISPDVGQSTFEP